jgi:hypothetical protein
MITDDFKLTKRAEEWIQAIHGKFSSYLVEDKRELPILSGSLTK